MKFSIFNFQFSISNSKRGFAIFVAVVVAGILTIIAFSISNLATKEIFLANLNKESGKAIFAANAGVECALYWDAKAASPFAVKMSTFGEIYITEFSGVDQSSSLDQKSDKTGYTSSDNELVTTNTVNTSIDEELIIGFFNESGNGPVTVGPNFNFLTTLNQNLLEYRTVSSAGSYNASGVFTNGGNENDYMADIVTFRAASGETPALAQPSKSEYISIPDPVELTFDNPSAGGNFILVIVSYNKDTFDLDSVIDDVGNQYHRALGPNSYPSSPWASEIWYAEDIDGGGSPITITANSPAFVPVDVKCNEQIITSGAGSQQITGTTTPGTVSRIGGQAATDNNNTSIFQLNFSDNTCSIVEVTKNIDGTTDIKSKGYNTCDTGYSRRVERGIEVHY